MTLVIVESPTKAKTLSKILSKDYDIMASMGHIRDLPKSGLGVDVEHNFKPSYEVPEKAKKTLSELKKAAKDAKDIILATDPDREGEAIAWHLRELLESSKLKDKNFSRVVFHELTQAALQEAFAKPGTLDMHLVDAQQARRVLDRLVGYKLSPLLWKKVRYGLSAGRVQSVAVRLIVEKERERTAFKPEEYWSIAAKFTDTSAKRPFNTELFEILEKPAKLGNASEVEAVKNALSGGTFTISAVNKTERKRAPYPPLKTSTLQQTMANTFGFTAKRTMQSAQKLFEKGYITYHRTDSLNLSEAFIQTARAFISKQFGKDYLPESAVYYKNNSKNAQEAHEAIRPTDVQRLPGSLRGLTAEEAKVYTVIWERALESQMNHAVYDQTAIIVSTQNGYKFKATGSIIKYPGWMAVDEFLGIKDEDEEMRTLPEYSVNERVNLNELNPEQHFTQPPARYTDASLIKKLEELGIGRPSTYAPTISTIQERGYVTKDGRTFVPTDVAYVVIDLLIAHFSSIVDFQFTAKMEDDLDDIADGKKEWEPVIREFYEPFEKTLLLKDKELQKVDVTTLEILDKHCPECNSRLVVKLGKYGKFISCSNYPECTYAEQTEEDKVMDENGEEIEDFGPCPKCGEGKLILKKGRFGKFLACNNYPKCKTTQPFLEKIGVKCPKCLEGDMVLRKARGRIFFGCSKYPECAFSSWQDPRKVDAKILLEKYEAREQREMSQPKKETVPAKVTKVKKATKAAKKPSKPKKPKTPEKQTVTSLT